MWVRTKAAPLSCVRPLSPLPQPRLLYPEHLPERHHHHNNNTNNNNNDDDDDDKKNHRRRRAISQPFTLPHPSLPRASLSDTPAAQVPGSFRLAAGPQVGPSF